MNNQGPLAIFRSQPSTEGLSDSDNALIEAAREAILTADSSTLSPENKDKLVACIYEISPNKAATASCLIELIREIGLAETWLTLRNGCIFTKTNGLERPQGKRMMELGRGSQDNGNEK